jgi:hypothetical protein
MSSISRYILALIAATMLLAAPALSYAETVRIGLPTTGEPAD